MGKFDGILICSDFDQTLGVEGTVSAENQAAIRYFEENGGLFTVISGRSPQFLQRRAEMLHYNAPIVGFNGALVCHHESGAVLYEGGCHDFDMFEIVKPFLDKDERIIKFVAHNKGVETPRYIRYPMSPTGKEECTLSWSEMVERCTLPLYNTICVTDCEEDAVALRHELLAVAGDRYEIVRSWPRGVEINRPEDSKGRAIRRVQELTGARLLVAMGDFENDIGMLKNADIGYAVGNALPAVKAAADRITVPCSEHAFVSVVRELEERDL